MCSLFVLYNMSSYVLVYVVFLLCFVGFRLFQVLEVHVIPFLCSFLFLYVLFRFVCMLSFVVPFCVLSFFVLAFRGGREGGRDRETSEGVGSILKVLGTF